jgi:uncharacterized membrane protein YjgN (DUF898 family)
MYRTELEDFDDNPQNGDPSPPPLPPVGIEFTGQRWPLFLLALKNGLLTLLTLGIYRFWAKTWIRRYFWHNTRIRGDALEYTGLPSELLIGFLIALAILVPFFGLYELLLFFAEGASDLVAQVANIGYFVLLLAFFQFAFYRMWRYRLSRTAWRSIHFGLDGSAVKFTFLSMGWTLVTVLTLGLAAPWARVALWKFRTNNTRFGNTNFGFEGSGKHLFIKWLLVWGTPIIITAVVGYLNLDTITMLQSANAEGTPATKEQVKSLSGAGAIGAFIFFTTFPFVYIWYRVREANYLITSSHLKDARFSVNIKAACIFWAYFLFFLSLFGVLVGISIVSTIVLSLVSNTPNLSTNFKDIEDVQNLLVGTGGAVFATQAIIGLLTYAIVSALSMVMIRHRITKHICSVVNIENSDVFDDVSQSAKIGPQHGEGFADALDVGAI